MKNSNHWDNIEDTTDLVYALACEGVNADIMAAKSQHVKNIKNFMKQGKGAQKAGNVSQAKKSYTSALSEIGLLKNKIEKIAIDADEDNPNSAYLSAIIGSFMTDIKGVLLCMTGIGAIVEECRKLTSLFKGQLNVFKKMSGKGQITISDFNHYKNLSVNVLDKQAAACKKAIKEMSASATESFFFDNDESDELLLGNESFGFDFELED